MIIAGIDPGKNGALFGSSDTGLILYAERVPLLKIKGKEKPDYVRMAQVWSVYLQKCDHVFIEQVGAMPGQGVSSMFNFGYVAGVAYGLVLAASVPVTFITPQKWKSLVGLRGSDGEESRQRASQLMPQCIDFWPRKKDDGVAEAALIAWAGRLIVEGKSSGDSTSNG